MLEIIYSFTKRIVFWMLVFLSARLLFIFYYLPLLNAEKLGFNEILDGFWHAIPLDISTAAYLMVFTCLITLFYLLLRFNFIRILDQVYMLIALTLFFLIVCGELGVYQEWRTNLNYKALIYLKNPGEIYQSASTWTFILLVFLLIMQVGLWFFIYLKYFQLDRSQKKPELISYLIFIVLAPGLLLIALRGGIDQIPINQSKSFYSKHNILNHAAVNPAYSFFYSMLENYRFRDNNPFLFMEQSRAEKIVKEMHQVSVDSTVSILKTKRPNIVLILLEGWSADGIESLGGDAGIAPYFKKMEQDGILFTRHYASGNRSDQGNVSVISGFPATPFTSISHVPEKSNKLPSLVKTLKKEGYSSSYYFGGQLIYGGIKSYVMSAGFDHVFEMDDFIDKYPRGKLGIHDEFMLMEQLSGLSQMPEPFFSMIFTVSSHSPYDHPSRNKIKFAEIENDYLNSIYYVDSCLNIYFESAKMKPWFNNTLFVLVSDHGHSSQRNWAFHSKEYRKIPLLLYGNVIRENFRGTQNDKISSQHDIAATLLHQLEINSAHFNWSRNLYNPFTNDFAFYEAGGEIGWITPDGYFVYRRETDEFTDVHIVPEKKDLVILRGQAYLQVLFQHYLDY